MEQQESRRESEQDAMRAALEEAQGMEGRARPGKRGGKACDTCYSASKVSDVDRHAACATCSGNLPSPSRERSRPPQRSHRGDGMAGGGLSHAGEAGMSGASAMHSGFAELRSEVEGLLKVLQVSCKCFLN